MSSLSKQQVSKREHGLKSRSCRKKWKSCAVMKCNSCIKIYRHSGTNCKSAGATRRGCSRVAKTCRRKPRNSCRGCTSWRDSAVMKKRSWFD